MLHDQAHAAANITWSEAAVTRDDRERRLAQRGRVVWLTGLSGSGKSTLAKALDHRLLTEGRVSYVLDGDNLRHGLNRDLAFSDADRLENIRRTGEVAALFADAGMIVIAALISPFIAQRSIARAACPSGEFIEVHLDTAMAVCEARDPKGLYRKARAGSLPGFTGIDAPYERPESPELRLDTATQSVEDCVAQIMAVLHASGAW